MLSETNNAFACDLYHQLATEHGDDNLFFSPYSMFNALAMCAEGARGTTAEELGNVLRLSAELRRSVHGISDAPWNLEPLHAGISEFNSLMSCDGEGAAVPGNVKESRMKLWHLSKRAEEAKEQGDLEAQREIAEETRREDARFRRIKARTDPNEIRVANALWGEKSCPFHEEFVECIERLYQKGGISPVDFKRNAEGARRLINDWVERQTNDRITDLLPLGSLTDLTRLVLVNAIYFKGKWVAPFDEAMTKPLDFTSSDGSAREVSTMIATDMGSASYAAFKGDGSFFHTPNEIPIVLAVDPLVAIKQDPVGRPGYPGADGFAMLDLPYEGHRLSMVLIAPNRPDGLAAIEQRLSGEALTRMIKRQKARSVHVVLPRFKFDPGYQMTEALGKMGLKRAFINPLNDDGADFRGMTSSDNPDDQLFISEIFHKAFVDVNEKGTEAAAATGVAMCGSAAGVPVTVPFIPVFKADRPFICIIRERPTGTILFMGRVMDPR
jgi:serpin B